LEAINILVIEDDKEINQLITKYLSKEGYIVKSAYEGKEALMKLSTDSFQLVILDLMLPYVDGYEVLRKIREKSRIPVLILTSKCEETEKIIGLGLGADDYMTKPFSMRELTARIKAQIRRYIYFNDKEGFNNRVLKHIDIEMNLDTYIVKISDEAIALTAKEFEILKLFMSNPKKVFTKTQVFNSVWGEEFMNDENTVMVHIRRLREKIEIDPSKPRYILTVWGIGYKLAEV
jgi:DNA-binding response OmpR family regulator